LGRARRRRETPKGEEVVVELEVDLEDLYLGKTLKVSAFPYCSPTYQSKQAKLWGSRGPINVSRLS